MNKWQPIETAPKDGTEILASGLNFGEGPERHYVVCYFNEYHNQFTNHSFDDHEYLTHWMPLPEPPNE